MKFINEYPKIKTKKITNRIYIKRKTQIEKKQNKKQQNDKSQNTLSIK